VPSPAVVERAALTLARRDVRPGRFFLVVNHYIVNQRDRGYGAIRSEVISVTRAGFRLSRDPDDRLGTEYTWPQPRLVDVDGEGVISIRRGANDLFLTLKPCQQPPVCRRGVLG
jgi:hypothetical protein